MTVMQLAAWQIFVACGCAGFGLGIGLVLAAFVARNLRGYMGGFGMVVQDPPGGGRVKPRKRPDPIDDEENGS